VIALAPSPLGVETLDDTACPEPLARATLRDIARANALFGGHAAAGWGLRCLLAGVPRDTTLTLVDVGAGSGDIARGMARLAARNGIRLRAVALDNHRVAAHLSRAGRTPTVLASAAALPFRPHGVDIVLASQFLHHFSRESAAALVAAFHRLARRGVVITEPRRSPLAAAGIWLAAHALRFHEVTRRDGVLSVRRSFTPAELKAVTDQAGVPAVVRRRPGFRVVAWWRTNADG
jgi:ubiquinone/menaquinone biosynthesis C-methylase UbiE